MATFSTNQVRQIIVANTYEAYSAATAKVNGHTPGSYNGIHSVGNDEVVFLYTNADGQTVKSDYIKNSKLRYSKVACFRPTKLKVTKVTMASAPVVGESYMLNIIFREWGSISPENQAIKPIGIYKAVTGDTQNTVLTKLKELGEANFKGDPKYLTFSIEGTGTNTALVITECAQPWVIGKKQARPLNYYIQPLFLNGDVNWAVIEELPGDAGIGTPRIAADMEYFYMGERGDFYRQVGYPYTIDTKYLVDNTGLYDSVELSFYFSDEGVSPQASEKQLVVLANKNNAVTAQIVADLTTAGITMTYNNNANAYPNQVVLSAGSLGVKGNAKITGLTTAQKYVVTINPGTVEATQSNVAADGTLTKSPSAVLAGTEIIGLLNGVTYSVVKI